MFIAICNTKQRLNRATLNGQITVTLQIVEELREIFNIKLYILGKKYQIIWIELLSQSLPKKEINPVRTLGCDKYDVIYHLCT